jgi:hypothetical protein
MKSVFSGNTVDFDKYLLRATPSQKLERWLGTETVEGISMKMRNWYGPPIPVAGVPGRVYACAGGDFCGAIHGGYFGNLLEFSAARFRSYLRVAARPQYQLNAGFASLQALIDDVKIGGLGQKFNFYKTGVTQPAASASAWLFYQGAGVPVSPTAPGSVATTPGGTVYTNTSVGGFRQISDAGTNTTFFISGNGIGNQTASNGSLMLVDYLWDANVQYNVTSNNITGVPTRYQTATTAPGNFMSGDTTATLGATAANLTITYVDQDGNAAEATATPLAIRTNSAVGTIPHTAPVWFVPLNAGDTGLRNTTNIAFSAGNGGYVARMIAHPLAIIPINQQAAVTGQAWSVIDGVNSAFQFERVYNGACLALMEFYKGGTTATSYTGTIMLASG